MRRGAALLLVVGVVCPASAETIRFVPTAGVAKFPKKALPARTAR